MSLEKLYTIEVNDAVQKNEECPFCYLENLFEKNALDFTLGSSYMESDVRSQTDTAGFCREHMEKMYRYGNALGNAWILKTRLNSLRKKYREYEKTYAEQNEKKDGILRKMKVKIGRQRDDLAVNGLENDRSIRYNEKSCFVCRRVHQYYNQALESFLYLVIQDSEFVKKIKKSKGFCMRHFPELIENCEKKLTKEQQMKYIPMLLDVMNGNLDRIQEDIDWFIEKYDYRNEKESWKNSRDAIQRTIGKINGVSHL